MRALAAAMLVLAAFPAQGDAADGEAAPPDEFTWVAGQECPIAGRTLDVHVKERVDPKDRTAAWLLEACVTGKDLPTSCLATMTAAEPLPQGMDESGRSFLVRCVPSARLAWVVDLKWTGDGLDLQAWRLDLEPLVTAPVVDGDGGLKAIELAPGSQLVPDEPHGWKAGDPRPSPACEPLSLEATAVGQDLEVVIRAASNACTSWRVRYEAGRGSFTASPLPGSAPPDILRDLPAGQGALKLEPGHALAPAAPAELPAARRARPAGRLSSFSRR